MVQIGWMPFNFWFVGAFGGFATLLILVSACMRFTLTSVRFAAYENTINDECHYVN
jgi:hypothetical protein